MIVAVARDEALRLRITTALRETRWNSAVTSVDTVGEAEEMLAGPTPPSVVVVGPGVGLAGAADVVVAAADLRSPPPVLLVAAPSTDLLRAAMRAGVRDVLPVDFEDGDLVRAFEEAGVSSEGPSAQPGVTAAVFSTKGGVGTSVIASNLAIRLAEKSGRESTLVDLDLASADQAIMHGLSPKWTIQDIADGGIGLDAESLRQVLLDVDGSRARLLPGPVDPALAETITGGDVSAVIAAVRAEAPIAVLDTSSGFDDRTLVALDSADAVVVVSSLDVSALRSLTVSLQTLRRLGISDDQITVTLVRADSKSGLVVADVERAIDRPVDVRVPSTKAVPKSVNEGVPLAISSSRSAVVTAIDELAELVLRRAGEGFRPETGAADSSRGGIFPWSRGGREDAPAQSAGSPPPPLRGSEVAPTPEVPQPEPPDGGPDDAHAPGATEAPEAAQVLPIRTRGKGEEQPVRRTVRRQVSSQHERTLSPVDADDAGDVGEASAARMDSTIGAMPPPIVVDDDDDEDDQPRRRRRR